MTARRSGCSDGHARPRAWRRLWAAAEIVEQVGQSCRRERQAGVGAAVVEPDHAGGFVEDSATGKDDAIDGSMTLVGHLRSEDPFVAALQHPPGLVEVEQRQTQSVEAAGERVPDALVEEQPAFRQLEGRGAEADLVGIPPSSATGVQEQVMIAPVPEIGRPRAPDVGPGTARRHRGGRGASVERWHQADGFWSVSVYNKDGFFKKNVRDAYTINNVTAKPSADESVTIHFGGDDTAPNYLPITPDWNCVVRMYRPRPEILDRSWRFPGARPVT